MKPRNTPLKNLLHSLRIPNIVSRKHNATPAQRTGTLGFVPIHKPRKSEILRTQYLIQLALPPHRELVHWARVNGKCNNTVSTD